MAKIINAFLLCSGLELLSQTRNRLIAISMYSIVQTGPKSQFGGLKNGFLSWAYQVLIDGVVKAEPIKPAMKVIKKETIIFDKFLMVSYIIAKIVPVLLQDRLYMIISIIICPTILKNQYCQPISPNHLQIMPCRNSRRVMFLMPLLRVK